jgi:predicted  nucleic acid-binding Zn-ribbon protein
VNTTGQQAASGVLGKRTRARTAQQRQRGQQEPQEPQSHQALADAQIALTVAERQRAAAEGALATVQGQLAAVQEQLAAVQEKLAAEEKLAEFRKGAWDRECETSAMLRGEVAKLREQIAHPQPRPGSTGGGQPSENVTQISEVRDPATVPPTG